MKMVALGTAPAAAPAAAPQTPAAPAVAPVQYAAILERNREGVIMRLDLPGPTAGSSVPLTIRTDDGGAIMVGLVAANGRVQPARDLPPNLTPGTKLVCATTPDGRVVGVHAMTPVGQGRARPGNVAHRSAAPSPVRRSGDWYEHDPNELHISGSVGRVIRVS